MEFAYFPSFQFQNLILVARPKIFCFQFTTFLGLQLFRWQPIRVQFDAIFLWNWQILEIRYFFKQNGMPFEYKFQLETNGFFHSTRFECATLTRVIYFSNSFQVIISLKLFTTFFHNKTFISQSKGLTLHCNETYEMKSCYNCNWFFCLVWIKWNFRLEMLDSYFGTFGNV